MLAIGLLALVGIMISLAYLAVLNANQKDSEKQRADSLQQSLDVLRDQSKAIGDRTTENQKFFDLVRQLVITTDAQQRQALIDQLRGIQFGSTTTTTTTEDDEQPSTTTTPSSSVTTAPTTTAPPSSTTTTTQRSPPSTVVCLSVPLPPQTKICK